VENVIHLEDVFWDEKAVKMLFKYFSCGDVRKYMEKQ
jgi:hypothetical protein